MISDQTRNDLRQGLLESDHLVRYYQAVAIHYQRKRLLTLLLLGLGASISFAAVLDLLPDVVQLVANVLVGVVAVWICTTDYARKAAVAHNIGFQCRHVDILWKRLWIHIERIDESDARQRLDDLADQVNMATQRSSDAGIVHNRRLNERARRWPSRWCRKAMPHDQRDTLVGSSGQPQRPGKARPPPPPRRVPRPPTKPGPSAPQMTHRRGALALDRPSLHLLRVAIGRLPGPSPLAGGRRFCWTQGICQRTTLPRPAARRYPATRRERRKRLHVGRLCRPSLPVPPAALWRRCWWAMRRACGPALA